VINVVCVLHTTPNSFIQYTPEYVQKLKRGFERNLSVPHRFVCFSNIDIEGVEVIPLQKKSWWGHWSKLEIFTPGVLQGPTIYSDIDALVCRNIDCLVEPKDNLVMLRDYYPHIYNSTLMYFDVSNSVYSELYRYMCDNEDQIKQKYEWAGHGKTHGDQALIYDFINSKNKSIDLWDHLFPSDMFMAFSGGAGLTPKAVAWDYNSPAAYVYCLGKPKFDQMQHLSLVQTHWI